MKQPILFLLKKSLIYGSYSSVIAKSGLLNSAKITAHQLEKHLHVKTDIEVCVDGNEIDKFLHQYKPRICIIEALWATPAKLYELTLIHKRITFIVLIHSETAFLSQEGNAIAWIRQYNNIDRVYPAFNSEEAYDQFTLLGIDCYYLPNIYLDVERGKDQQSEHRAYLNIGCFGAVRPFKNQLIQAVASIIFCQTNKKILHFHINSSRIEQVGESVLKNIKALFESTPHKLVEHGWMERDSFLRLVSKMDIGMQISFTETFNIIAADFVHQHIPIVVSKTINWMPSIAQASVEDMDDILHKMNYAMQHRNRMAQKNTRYLKRYNERAIDVWGKFLT